MGRGCTMDEWVHFEKLPESGRVPNSSYWYVQCRHCVAGFAQKQLVNAPARLTGRRTSMRAHLKVCPVYAARYKAELAAAAAKAQLQQAAEASVAAEAAPAGVIADGAAAGAAAVPDDKAPNAADGAAAPAVASTVVVAEVPTSKRKRKIAAGEVIGPRGGRGKHCIMEEWEHFTRLQDDGYIGKTNFFYAICNHCQRAFDEAPAEKKSALVPERMVGRREKMRKHLGQCPHFEGELPPVERRVVVRGVAPFSAISGSAGILDGGVAAEAGKSVSALSQLQAASSAAAAAAAAIGLASAVAAGAQASPSVAGASSSRLAMDEWQYFTRLERKKDSAYYFARCNFCQRAIENAPEPLRSSMEPVIVVGRKANMQTHLFKCPHVPREMISVVTKASPVSSDARAGAAVAGAAASTGNAAAGANGWLDVRRDEHGSPAAKRARIDTHDDAAPGVDSRSFNSALLEFTIQHRLPFEWVESETTKQLFRTAMQTPEVDALLPSPQKLRTEVLDETYNRIALGKLLLLPEPLPTGIGASVSSTPAASATAAGGERVSCSDVWPLTMQCTTTLSTATGGGGDIPVLHCAVTNGKLHVPVPQLLTKRGVESSATGAGAGTDAVHEEIPAVAHNHGLEVARWLDAQLRHCQLQNAVPAVVVLPYSAAFDRAVKILRGLWPRVVFVFDFQGLLQFCLKKVLALEEVQSLVAALAELWTNDGVRLASHITNPFKDWQECSLFMQSLVDETSLFTTNAELKAAVDEKASRSLLERVSLLLRAFSIAYESASEKQLSFAETARHVGVLFYASQGFASIQRALEVVWSEMEQPLFILAHVLHPHLRLGEMASSDLTKLSKLSDLGVTYFAALVGMKASSLRGEMTAYLHTSQPVFEQEFVDEFPVLDDYFRYLSDDYASLSVLMRLLRSLSSVCAEKPNQYASNNARRRATRVTAAELQMYTPDERKKFAYVMECCGLKKTKCYGSRIVHETESGDAAEASVPDKTLPQTGESILQAWSRVLTKASAEQGMDFALLEAKHAADGNLVESSTAPAATPAPSDKVLPSQAADDEVAFPSTFLSGDRAKKISLKDLFKPVEATI